LNAEFIFNKKVIQILADVKNLAVCEYELSVGDNEVNIHN